MENYTVSELELMSDKELNRLVYLKLGVVSENNYIPDYCNSWDSIMPIAYDNEIDLILVKSNGTNIEGMTLARNIEHRLFRYEKKVQRAIVIIYLLMKGIRT